MAETDPSCMSAYLALRYVPRADWAFRPGIAARLPASRAGVQARVGSPTEIVDALRARLREVDPARTGLLLSGGIDSAILAALLPRGVRAYTIRFVAPGAIDESERAAAFAARAGLSHHVVDVTWQDYLEHAGALMQHKRAPLHAIEVALHVAARRAAADGVDTLVVGNGADSTFGGLDKLLSRDWTFDAFVERYTFVEPEHVLAEPRSVRPLFEPYRRGDGIDAIGFLKHVHGTGIVQSFENAIEAAGCSVRAPYEDLALSVSLDLARIRSGEPKYLLVGVFDTLFGGMPAPEKIAFARPMDRWLADWRGPARREFKPGLPALSGDQRWLVYCLESFLDLLDAGRVAPAP